MTRPADLPDFSRPPLNEVVLGVQFSPPAGYAQIQAGEVWNLFREKYPRVEEYMPLPSAYELFGLPGMGQPPNQFSFLEGPLHDRYWFLRPTGEELIQFQNDRLLHNWRKVGDSSNPYPRFENMLPQFEEELNALENYLGGLAPQKLAVNQYEISYINHIPVSQTGDFRVSDWFKFLNEVPSDSEGFQFGFREVVKGQDDSPLGRLFCEVVGGYKPTGERLISLTLTVRGAPGDSTIKSALDSIVKARKIIVDKFSEITTPVAHKLWGRK